VIGLYVLIAIVSVLERANLPPALAFPEPCLLPGSDISCPAISSNQLRTDP
jgi:hypothetical protein